MARRVDEATLKKIRSMPLLDALDALDLYFVKDETYQPRGNAGSIRLNVSVGQDVREMIFTGTQWFDLRAGKGGGGAIDLAMHLLGVSLTKAIRELQKNQAESLASSGRGNAPKAGV